MNKKVLIGIAVLLLALAVGWGVMTSKKTAEGQTPVTIDEDGIGGPANTLSNILSKGGSQTCTFSTPESSGTMYVSGGKVKADFDVLISGQSTKSHMIVMDSTSYIWTEGQPLGFKMTFDPETSTDTNTTAQAGFNPTANYDYKCSSWTPDAAMFTLPIDVSFNTLNIPTQPGDPPEPANNGSEAQCAYCDSLTGDNKSQCLTALKCK